MKVVNFNDKIRKNIYNALKGFDGSIKNINEEKLMNLYYYILENDKIKYNYIGVMYLTSYIFNYVLHKDNPDDKNFLNAVDFLESFDSVEDFVSCLTPDIFNNLCYDVLLFSFIDKKEYINKALANKDFIINMFPSFINDVISYNMKKDSYSIIEYYYKQKEKSLDEDKCFNKAINFGVDLLKKIEEEDFDAYQKSFKKIINDYYIYNKNLLLNNKELSVYSKQIMNTLEETSDNILLTLNDDMLATIVSEFLNFNILSKDDKDKILTETLNKVEPSNYDRQVVKNYNTSIRKKLYEYFSYLQIADKDSAFLYKDTLDYLKKHKNFDEIVKVLYLDGISLSCYDYFSSPNDSLFKSNYEFFNSFNDIEEFKYMLLDSDVDFLYSILDSKIFYELSIVEKKKLINTLVKNKAYEKFNTDNYIFDILEFSRDYDLYDTYEIYKNEYFDSKDKKIAIACASYNLIGDLNYLKETDLNNYNSLIYDISKIFYEYNKYLIDNGEIEKSSLNLINLMEEDLNKYFSVLSNNDELLDKIINSFYKYVSYDNENKNNVKDYLEKLDKKGKIKVFKKNKNSN